MRVIRTVLMLTMFSSFFLLLNTGVSTWCAEDNSSGTREVLVPYKATIGCHVTGRHKAIIYYPPDRCSIKYSPNPAAIQLRCRGEHGEVISLLALVLDSPEEIEASIAKYRSRFSNIEKLCQRFTCMNLYHTKNLSLPSGLDGKLLIDEIKVKDKEFVHVEWVKRYDNGTIEFGGVLDSLNDLRTFTGILYTLSMDEESEGFNAVSAYEQGREIADEIVKEIKTREAIIEKRKATNRYQNVEYQLKSGDRTVVLRISVKSSWEIRSEDDELEILTDNGANLKFQLFESEKTYDEILELEREKLSSNGQVRLSAMVIGGLYGKYVEVTEDNGSKAMIWIADIGDGGYIKVSLNASEPNVYRTMKLGLRGVRINVKR